MPNSSKRFHFLFPLALYLTDVICILMSFAVVFYLNPAFYEVTDNVRLLVILILSCWGFVLTYTKDYIVERAIDLWNVASKALRSITIFSVITLLSLFLIEYDAIPRSILFQFFCFSSLSLIIERMAVHKALLEYRKRGLNFRNAVVIGYDRVSQLFFDNLRNRNGHGIICSGFFTDESELKENYPVLGRISEFIQSDWTEVDYVYVSGNLSHEQINRIISKADNEFVKVKILPDFLGLQSKVYTLKKFNYLSIIEVNDLPLDSEFNRFLKRSFDVIFSLIIIIFFLSWLYPLIALFISIESKGRIIFKQKRHGRNNKVFDCYKFRTMVINAEADTKWAVKNDPRVTKIGAILRKTSLDELPQFFNVLVGEMSIVGPRPHAIEMNDHYKDKVDRFSQRHTHKPGITGLAQAMGYRGEIRELSQIKNRVKLDRFYLQNWSFFFDIKILIKTVLELFRGQESAY
jgi:putative colanic acid biosynthesis UDP-glucose lipid carrier transferase